MLECLLANNPSMSWKAAPFVSPKALAYGNACVIGDDIYYYGRDSSSAYSSLYRIRNNVITVVTTIPRARFGMRLVGWQDGIYFFGTGTSAEDRILQKYTISTNTWSNHLTYNKDWLWASVCQEKGIAYITATGTARDCTAVTKLDLTGSTVKITEFPAEKVDRAHMLISAFNGKVYFGGGLRDIGNFEIFSDFHCLDPASGVQTKLTDMPEAGYYALTYGSVNGRLLAVNPQSGTNASATATISKNVLSFNYATEKWNYEKSTAVAVSHAQCYVKNNNFVRIGGRDQTLYYSAAQIMA